MVLTDFVHRDTESFQFGAAGQEVCRNVLHTVLAHIKQLDLRQTERRTKLSYTVTEKREKEKCHRKWRLDTAKFDQYLKMKSVTNGFQWYFLFSYKLLHWIENTNSECVSPDSHDCKHFVVQHWWSCVFSECFLVIPQHSTDLFRKVCDKTESRKQSWVY